MHACSQLLYWLLYNVSQAVALAVNAEFSIHVHSLLTILSKVFQAGACIYHTLTAKGVYRETVIPSA